MNVGDENPYAAPNVAELPATTDVPLEHPGLPKFLLQGLYVALLMAPFIALHQSMGQSVGLKLAIPSFFGNVSLSVAGIYVAALGDGLTAMLCWRIVKNEPSSLTPFAAGMGTRILAILCHVVVAMAMKWQASAVPYFIVLGLYFGLPSLFLTMVFLRLLNRGISWWVYPTVFFAASLVGFMFNLVEAGRQLYGAPSLFLGEVFSIARDALFLCVLAAILWFGVRVSRPTFNPTAARP